MGKEKNSAFSILRFREQGIKITLENIIFGKRKGDGMEVKARCVKQQLFAGSKNKEISVVIHKWRMKKRRIKN
jgi:hypothetical protein